MTRTPPIAIAAPQSPQCRREHCDVVFGPYGATERGTRETHRDERPTDAPPSSTVTPLQAIAVPNANTAIPVCMR